MKKVLLFILLQFSINVFAQYGIEEEDNFEIGLGGTYSFSRDANINKVTDLFINKGLFDYDFQLFGNYLIHKKWGVSLEFSAMVDVNSSDLEDNVNQQLLIDLNQEFLFLESEFEKNNFDSESYSSFKLNIFHLYQVNKVELRPYLGLGAFSLPTYNFQGYLKKINANDILYINTYAQDERVNLLTTAGINILYNLSDLFSIALNYNMTHLSFNLTYIESITNNFTQENLTRRYDYSSLNLHFVGLKVYFKIYE